MLGNTLIDKLLGPATKEISGLESVLRKVSGTIANIGIGFAVGATITGVIKLLDALHVSAEEANEAMDISFSSYEDAKSQLESVNSELESTNSRISELKSKGSLSFVEQSELENLKEVRKELELQQDLAEKAETKAAKDAGNKALEAYEKNYGDFEVSQKKIYDYLKGTDITGNNASLFTNEKDISALMAGIQQMKELQKEARSEGDLEEVSRYQDIIDSTTDAIWKQVTSLENYKSKLSEIPEDMRSQDQIDAINEISDSIDFVYKQLDPSKWKDIKFDEIISSDDSFDDAVDDLEKQSKAAGDAGISVNDLKKQYPELANAITAAGMSVSDFVNEINAQAQGIETATTDIEALESSFRSFQVSAVDAINQVDTINAALVNSFSGKGLEIGYEESEDGIVSLTGDIVNLQNAYSDLEGYKPELLFEKTANGVHINREALRALQAQEEALTKKGFIEKQTELQSQLAAASEKLKEAQAAGDSVAAADQQNVISTLQDQIQNVQLLASAYDGATSAYQKWINAQSSGEEGDMFRNVSETMKERGEELYKEGRYNTEEFRAIADYFSYDDLSTASMEEVVKAYENASNARDAYFTGTKEGIDNFMTDMMRVSESEGYDWIKTTEDGFMEFNTGADEEIAQRFNLSKEAVQSLFRAASEYTDNIRLGDTSGIDNLDQQLAEATQKAEEAKAKLKELQTQGEITSDIKLDVDVSQLDESGIEDRIKQLTDLKEEATIKFGADSSEVEYVDQLLTEANARKEQLAQETATNISVNISGNEDIDVLKDKLSSLPKDETSNVSINIQNESQIDSVVQEIQNIPSDTPVNLSLTVQNEEQADALESKLSGLESEGHHIEYSIDVVDNTGDALNKDITDDTKTITVNEVKGTTVDIEDDTKTVTVNEIPGMTVNVQDETKTVTVNYTKGSQTPPDDRNATVNYDKGDQEKPSDETAKVNYILGNQDLPLSKTATVNYALGSQASPENRTAYVNYIATGDTGGKSTASGTMLSPARASGSAYNVINTIPAHVDGNVSLRKDEKALVNEFAPQAPESIVRDGRWFIIPGGPHIEDLKKGDIIFNANQTAELLKSGKTSVPGKAFADGTVGNIRRLVSTSLSAFSSGSWVFGNTGGGNLKGSGSVPSSYSPSNSNTQSYSSAPEITEQVAENTQEIADSTEEAADAADEFKEAFDYIEIAIDRVEREISNIERTAESAYNAFSTRNSAIQQEMAAITKEIDLQQQAYSRYLQEANSVGLSEDYASKVRNGTIDIETITDETLADNIKSYQDYYEKALDAQDATEELKESIKDLYQESFDNIVELYDGIISQIDHEREMIESDISQLESKGHINTSNYYRQLIDIENENVAELLDQREKLIDSLNNAVSSGEIKEYSSAWYDMKNEINDVDEAIQSANESLIDYNNSMRDIQMDIFDYYSDQYDQIMSKYDHKGNTIENNISLDETGGNIAKSTDYDKLISNELDRINVLINKRNDLTKVMNQAVSSGIIEKESDEWYEMQQGIDAVSEAIQEANINLLDRANSIEQIQWDTFEKISDNYDNILASIDNKRNTLDSFISQTEDKGYLVSAEYYEALIQNEKDNVNKLTKERNDLIASMNKSLASGNMEKYSDVWYDMQQEIDSVSEALQEANSNLVEYNNSIRELEWEVFDKIQDAISGITDESDFLIDLMSNDKLYDDKGKVTDEGKATIGLHGVNYNTYMSQADEYRKEMEKIQKELSDDPYNYELIERRKELLELQRESILAAEDEKEAIRDLVEDGINKQLDALQELIDKYTDALDQEKDLYDYQKEMEEKQSNISSLEKQLSAYQGDNSEEGTLKRQDLQNQLDEAKSDLEDSQYEKSISETKKLLDDLYSQYELILNMRLDNIDLLITEVIANINAESAGIRDTLVSQANSVGYQLSDTMNTIWGDNGKLIGVITTYGNNFTTAITGVQTAINSFKVLVQDAIKEARERAEAEIKKAEEEKKKQQEAEAAKKKQQQASKESSTKKPASTPVKETVNKPVSKPQKNTSKPKPSTPKPTQPKPATGGDGVPKIGDKVTFVNGWYYLDSYGSSPIGNQHLGEELYITYMNPGSPYPVHLGTKKEPGYYSDLGWVKLDQIKGYKKGIKNIQKQQLAWTQEGSAGKASPEAIIRKSDGAVLMPMNIGDAVLTSKATENLWNAANNPAQFIQENIAKNIGTAVPKSSVSSGNPVNNIAINISVDKVQDYNDFVRQLQSDHKFEKLIQSMSVDKLLKNNKFNKFNINL